MNVIQFHGGTPHTGRNGTHLEFFLFLRAFGVTKLLVTLDTGLLLGGSGLGSASDPL